MDNIVIIRIRMIEKGQISAMPDKNTWIIKVIEDAFKDKPVDIDQISIEWIIE